MHKAYLNKYQNGKSQTIQARERAEGATHHSRVRDYLDEMDSAPIEQSPVVVTIPPARNKHAAPMAQMMLFDQPVTVKLAEPREAAPSAASVQKVQPAVGTGLTPRIVRMSDAPAARTVEGNELTVSGLLKGCGLGLASAAALLLAYLVIT
jgi:hypothetical protein